MVFNIGLGKVYDDELTLDDALEVQSLDASEQDVLGNGEADEEHGHQHDEIHAHLD